MATGKFLVDKRVLRMLALDALNGVGNATHQWEEWTGKAFHIRRRLTEVEEQTTGPAVDIRGTPEALSRINRVREVAPFIPLDFLLTEA